MYLYMYVRMYIYNNNGDPGIAHLVNESEGRLTS